MAYKMKRHKDKPLTLRQSKRLFEILRNDTSMDGKEIVEVKRKMQEKKLIKKSYY